MRCRDQACKILRDVGISMGGKGEREKGREKEDKKVRKEQHRNGLTGGS